MPFIERITNMMTPHRVYALCKLAHFFQYEEKQEVTRGEMADYLQPPVLNEKKGQFKEVFSFAVQGNLIEENVDGKVKTTLSASELSTADNFRRAIIRRAILRKDLMFWRFTSWYIMRDNKVFSEKPIGLANAFNQEINVDQSMTYIYNDTNINGWRTWAVFLGYGYVHNDIVIPNIAIRLKDLFMENNQLTRDKSMSFASFMQWLGNVAPELDGGDICLLNRGKSELRSQYLSLGLSSGLRALHDQKIIHLKRGSDALDTWHLTNVSYHEISELVSEIMIRSEW